METTLLVRWADLTVMQVEQAIIIQGVPEYSRYQLFSGGIPSRVLYTLHCHQKEKKKKRKKKTPTLCMYGNSNIDKSPSHLFNCQTANSEDPYDVSTWRTPIDPYQRNQTITKAALRVLEPRLLLETTYRHGRMYSRHWVCSTHPVPGLVSSPQYSEHGVPLPRA